MKVTVWTYRVLLGLPADGSSRTPAEVLSEMVLEGGVKSIGQSRVEKHLLAMAKDGRVVGEVYANNDLRRQFKLTPVGVTLVRFLYPLPKKWGEKITSTTYQRWVVKRFLEKTQEPMTARALAKATLMSPDSVRRGVAALGDEVEQGDGVSEMGSTCWVYSLVGKKPEDAPVEEEDKKPGPGAGGELTDNGVYVVPKRPALPPKPDPLQDLNWGKAEGEEVDLDHLYDEPNDDAAEEPVAASPDLSKAETATPVPDPPESTVTPPPEEGDLAQDLEAEIEELERKLEQKPAAEVEVKTPGNGDKSETFIRVPLKIWEQASMQATYLGMSVEEYLEVLIMERQKKVAGILRSML